MAKKTSTRDPQCQLLIQEGPSSPGYCEHTGRPCRPGSHCANRRALAREVYAGAKPFGGSSPKMLPVIQSWTTAEVGFG